MDEVVVTGTEQREVGQIGRSAVAPKDDVVSIGVGDRPIASRESAAAIADRQGSELVGGDGADTPGVVESSRRSVVDPVDHTVAQEAVRR